MFSDVNCEPFATCFFHLWCLLPKFDRTQNSPSLSNGLFCLKNWYTVEQRKFFSRKKSKALRFLLEKLTATGRRNNKIIKACDNEGCIFRSLSYARLTKSSSIIAWEQCIVSNRLVFFLRPSKGCYCNCILSWIFHGLSYFNSNSVEVDCPMKIFSWSS